MIITDLFLCFPFLGKFSRGVFTIGYLGLFNKIPLLLHFSLGFFEVCLAATAVSKLTDILYDVLDKKEIALSIVIDLSKAFDTVDHRILLRKLERYGVIGLALDLVKDYLTSRTHSVKISDVFSAPKPINSCVPKGSALGPLLFLIYINDLPNFSEYVSTILDADDITLNFRSNSVSNLFNHCSQSLDVFFAWTRANKLTINASKPHFMMFSNRQIDFSPYSVNIGNFSFNRVNSFKFLGLYLDEKFTFREHCTHVG